MAFAAAICLLLYRHRQGSQQQAQQEARAAQGRAAGSTAKRSSGAQGRGGGGGGQGGSLADRLARTVQLLEVQLLFLLTAAVAYGRVYLGYHSPAQVAAGLALGAACAAAWWRLTLAACRSAAARALLRWAPLRALHLRNTLGCPDVHAAEAALFAGCGRSAEQRRDGRAD